MLRWDVGILSRGVVIVAMGVVLFASAPVRAEINASDYITIRDGRIPVIISAPHGGDKPLPGAAPREDHGQKFFATVRDQNTAQLAERLAAHLTKLLGGQPYLVIARFDRQHIDVNRAPADAYTPPGDNGPKDIYHAYHTALANATSEVERRWGRGVLLDIHGQSRFPDQIIRGTHNGETVTSLVKRFGDEALTGPRSLFGALAKQGYSIAPSGAKDDRREIYFSGGHIVETHGSSEGGNVDAIQVEIGSRFRSSERLDQTARDLAAATAVFAKAYLPMKPK